MESHGVPGRIQVSEQFHNLTAAAFLFEDRGATDIKSIGATRTYFLMGDIGSITSENAGAIERRASA